MISPLPAGIFCDVQRMEDLVDSVHCMLIPEIDHGS